MKTMMVVNQNYDEYEAREGIKTGKSLKFYSFVLFILGFFLGASMYNFSNKGYTLPTEPRTLFIIISIISLIGWFVLYSVGENMIKKNKIKLKKAMIKRIEVEKRK
jgi:hypothetical protein